DSGGSSAGSWGRTCPTARATNAAAKTCLIVCPLAPRLVCRTPPDRLRWIRLFRGIIIVPAPSDDIVLGQEGDDGWSAARECRPYRLTPTVDRPVALGPLWHV